MGIRYDWQKEEIRAIYDTPFLELIYQAASVHRQYHNPKQIQVCKLISIKTGACPEDCSYCAQSSRYKTEVKPQALLDKETVVNIAQQAKNSGVSRVCMGAAWREVRDNSQFDQVLDMVKEVTALGLEVCCTLGMLTENQAKRLEAAGLYAYNHNLDTSPEYYSTIITTRTYSDRLNTINNVRQTNVTVCSGGIIGLGENVEDRVSMLHTLANLDPHPESVPVNILSKVQGTPLENQPDVPIWDVVRMIATARLIMPASDVRLSAGRAKLSQVEQALCFLAGANSIFSSDDGHMLTVTTPCPGYDADQEMLNLLGLEMRPPFVSQQKVAAL
ncbi:biotin synthase BioB [Fischerella thermalis CCMEE 5198]|uniref:biotin synthase BioB n=1 Tax=Fischerella thermalis TaxID=372787 RepID=UPI000C7FD90A|nr:biotin synthase BioB [Fischerella thermalis]PMB04120.1 biotin synthase BioB [Fischerella thermalis CCMEE 5196]PMB19470.1 biotin synthase BioB [Fischerella thermalis CCMEE 5198]